MRFFAQRFELELNNSLTVKNVKLDKIIKMVDYLICQSFNQGQRKFSTSRA